MFGIVRQKSSSFIFAKLAIILLVINMHVHGVSMLLLERDLKSGECIEQQLSVAQKWQHQQNWKINVRK